MKERPILFSGPMVRAILEGRKTMTRRVVKAPEWFEGHTISATTQVNGETRYHDVICDIEGGEQMFCPYGTPGDRLWVRESSLYVSDCGLWLCRKTGRDGIGYEVWSRDGSEHFAPDDRITAWEDWDKGMKELPKTVVSWSTTRYGQKKGSFTVGFCVNDTTKQISMTEPHHVKEYEAVFRKRVPAIHMPRWASRITLEITGVRVERLQAITWEDAEAEGIQCVPTEDTEGSYWCVEPNDERGVADRPDDVFSFLWASINGRESWDANPWVWVVSFRRVGE